MNTRKTTCIIGVLLGCGALVVVTTSVGSKDQNNQVLALDVIDDNPTALATREPCKDCEFAPFQIIPITGDPKIDTPRIQKTILDQKKKVAEMLKRESEISVKARYNSWRGTKVNFGDPINGANDPHVRIARKLETLATPDERKNIFAEGFGPEPEIKCIGWRAGLISSKQVEDGWVLEMKFTPDLWRKKGGAPFTWRHSLETWHFPNQGEPKLVKITGQMLDCSLGMMR